MLRKLIGRRTFLVRMGTTAASLVAVGIPVTEAEADDSTQCCVEESGELRQWPLVIGVLYSDKPEQHNRQIRDIRSEAKYNRIFKFNSTEKNRIPFGQGMIDFFVQERSLRFKCLIVNDDLSLLPDVANQQDERYFSKYRYLLKRDFDELHEVVLFIRQRRTLRDRVLEDFLKNISERVDVRRVPKQPDNLTQLAGLLRAVFEPNKRSQPRPKRS